MDRSVVITGCSSGIGRATARAFREEDWTVVATARDETDLTELAEVGCRTISLDVTDPDEIARLREDVISEVGPIDCLVNNAGYSQPGPVEDIPPTRLARQFDVNVYGPHRLTRTVLPGMREQGDGTIVNVSSVVARISLPGVGAYAATKHALTAMSEAQRVELAPTGVDVVLVEPGLVETAFHTRMRRELDELDRSDAYDRLYGILDDWVAIDGGPIATRTSSDVADVIVDAAAARNPRAHYTVGPFARLAILARMMPAGIRDSVLRAAIRVIGWADR